MSLRNRVGYVRSRCRYEETGQPGVVPVPWSLPSTKRVAQRHRIGDDAVRAVRDMSRNVPRVICVFDGLAVAV